MEMQIINIPNLFEEELFFITNKYCQLMAGSGITTQDTPLTLYCMSMYTLEKTSKSGKKPNYLVIYKVDVDDQGKGSINGLIDKMILESILIFIPYFELDDNEFHRPNTLNIF
jgi:hypothetical protein